MTVVPSWTCHACGYIGTAQAFSADWYRGHKAAHMAAFPDLDQVSIDNLDMMIERAVELEGQ